MDKHKVAYLEEIKNYGAIECTDQKAWFYMDSLIAEVKKCWKTIEQQQQEIEKWKHMYETDFESYDRLQIAIDQVEAQALRYQKALFALLFLCYEAEQDILIDIIKESLFVFDLLEKYEEFAITSGNQIWC